MVMVKWSFILFFLFVSQLNLFAQTSSPSVLNLSITTIDHQTFKGVLLSQDDKTITLQTNSAKVTIDKAKIKVINYDDQNIIVNEDNDIKRYRNFPSRYFVGSSAYSLKKGEAYFSNDWIFFNEIDYGVTNSFSVGAGIIPLFLINGFPTPVWIKAKIAIPLSPKNINMSVGAMTGTIIGGELEGFPINLNGSMTFGSLKNNLTLGANIFFIDNNHNFIFNVSAKLNLTNKTSIMTDNFFTLSSGPDFENVSLVGARTIFGKLALDYGLFIPTKVFDEEFILLPFLGVKIGI